MDEIDQFILTNFSKLDKKIKQKEKKEKPAVKSKEESSLILSNIIDEGIYSSISSDKKNLDVRSWIYLVKKGDYLIFSEWEVVWNRIHWEGVSSG